MHKDHQDRIAYNNSDFSGFEMYMYIVKSSQFLKLLAFTSFSSPVELGYTLLYSLSRKTFISTDEYAWWNIDITETLFELWFYWHVFWRISRWFRHHTRSHTMEGKLVRCFYPFDKYLSLLVSFQLVYSLSSSSSLRTLMLVQLVLCWHIEKSKACSVSTTHSTANEYSFGF